MAEEGQDAVVQVFFVRDGKLIGRDHFYMKTAPGDSRPMILSSFLKQFYAGTPFIPVSYTHLDVYKRQLQYCWN